MAMFHFGLHKGELTPYDFGHGSSVDGSGPSSATEVVVKVDGEDETVLVDPERGPQVISLGLASSYRGTAPMPPGATSTRGHAALNKRWNEMSSTEQQVALLMAAKINRQRRR